MTVRRNSGHDIPIKHLGITIRSPRDVIVLHPFQVPLVLCLFVLTVVFTGWPDALQHTPIGGFETQGPIHHIWHYALMFGSLLILVGMFWTSTRRLTVELAGVFILMGGLAMNLVAVVGLALDPGNNEEPSGLGMALRSGVILGLGVRAYIIIRDVTVTLSAPKVD